MSLRRRYLRILNFFARPRRNKLARKRREKIADEKHKAALKAAAFKPEFEGRLPNFSTCITALSSMDNFKIFAEYCQKHFKYSPSESVDVLAHSLSIFEEVSDSKMTPRQVQALNHARIMLGTLIGRFPPTPRKR